MRISLSPDPNLDPSSAGPIAIVHDTLAASDDESVDFDQIVDRVLAMVIDVSASPSPVRPKRIGAFGELSGQVATPLSMVLTELLQNAFEHGLTEDSRLLEVRARREPDLLVVATAGGRPIDAIPGPIPGNARLAQYLPFEWMLPKVDVFVTNGGYGSVNQAMSFGIPLVTAGLTEDKADVNARVAWSGVGINLATNKPTPQALREAVRTVLDKPDYRSHAASMSHEFDGIDTRSEILRIVNQVSHAFNEVDLRRGGTTIAVNQGRRVGRR